MRPFLIVPMKPTPQPTPEETTTERSLTIILGAFAVGFTAGVLGLAAVLASLPSN